MNALASWTVLREVARQDGWAVSQARAARKRLSSADSEPLVLESVP